MTAQRSHTFGALLKRYRDEAGLTQEELAGRSGLGVRTISNLERGVNKTPYQNTVRRLANALELSQDEINTLSSSARASKEEINPPEAPRSEVRGGFLGAVPPGDLVAREKESGRVLEALGEVAGGSGRTLFLAGEPGIGKTRLAQEAHARARLRGFLVAVGRCHEAHSDAPFYPFLEALSMLHDAAPPEIREGISKRWPYAKRLLPDHYPSRAAPRGSSERPEELQWLLRAVAGFVREAASHSPVALLLDDLHWADSASLDLLAHLVRHTRGDRVFVLGTYRDVEVGRGHPLRGLVSDLDRENLVERLRLRRFGRAGTAALMSERLDGTEVSGEFAGLVHEHTEGNPFFTVEALRALVERGDLARWEGKWVRKEITDIEIPENVSEAISERVSRLRPATREALESASVLGQTFEFEDLSQVSASGEEAVEDALEEAEGVGIVQTDGDLYSFNHPLTRQSLYADLSPARRRRLHRAAAEAIEGRGNKARKRRAAEVFRHFSEGGESARAFPYALLAGEAAESVFTLSEAEKRYRDALQLAEDAEDRTGEMESLVRLGATLTTTARYDEALVALEKARGMAVESSEKEIEARAAARAGLTHFYKGGAKAEYIEGLRSLTEDLESSAAGVPGVSAGTMAGLWRALAALFFTARRYGESLEAARKTASFAREAEDEPALVRAEMARGQALIFLRRPEEASDALEAALALAEESEDAMNVLFGTLMLDLLDTARGDFERGLAWSERGLALAERLGNPHEISVRRARSGLIHFYRGDWKKAGELLEQAAETSRSAGPMFLSAWAPAYLAKLRVAEGKWTEAAGLIEESRDLAEKVRWPTPLRYALSLRAELDILEGRPKEAAVRLEPVAEAPEHDWLYAAFLFATLAWAHLESGDAKEAEKLADRAVAEAATIRNHVDAVGALRVKGMALASQGRKEEAIPVFEEALSLARSMPYPYAEARILRECGKVAGESAKELLSAARDVFRRLGATRDYERIERAIRDLAPRD